MPYRTPIADDEGEYIRNGGIHDDKIRIDADFTLSGSAS